MSTPKEILRLVDHFEQNFDSYKSGHYNEAQLRSEFLDPFFKALGWDMDNVQGLAEAYKDVVHEDAIRIGGAVKAPDYCFRIGGTRKFFLEAKKPSVVVSEEISAAYQLRRYAWSGKLPLSILSDFEEFAVYDCRIKPNKTDSAAAARVFICRFNDYPEKWEWISSIFSKDAILKGSFDKYAETNKAKRGTAEVDDDILATIEHWRSELARILALRNSRLSQRELNFAVQRIIDRIIFLRICEDRGIETYGRLLALTNGPNIYPRLGEIFEDADGKYNSGLFYFKAEKGRHEPPDEITLGLDVDDKLLRELLKGLYYPESPYEFTVISSDILGHVYEQFLGKVIRLTAGHHAVVEDKPEVKKAGGVYYTPTYIVEYIVRQTVGKLVEKKTPKQIAKLRVLDPACGSGSFLINAYQFLLDWHRDWYVAHKPESWTKGRNPVLVQTTSGWKLTIAERKRILLDNIYGVDIDPQAVEVTKLSLLLKVLEGESEQTIQPFLRLFQQRALPDLGDNIKCGNSLIGPDFYQQQNLPLMSDDDRLRVNVFDWDAEFPEIMKSGGFDAVIGNPPYLFITELTESEKHYFFHTYETSEYRFDVYGLFMELSIEKLVRKGGYVSFIIPHTLLSNDSYEKLRRLILSKTALETVIDIGPGVFEGARNETMIFVARNIIQRQSNKKTKVLLTTAKTFLNPLSQYAINQSDWLNNSKAVWLVKIPFAASAIAIKLEKTSHRLGDICTINQGLRTGDNDKFLSETKRSGTWKHALGGKHIGRYGSLIDILFVQYEPKLLDAPRRPEIFESSEKLIIQEVRNITLPRRLIATYDNRQFYCLQSTNVINLRESVAGQWSIKFLLSVLNSNVANYFFRYRFSGNNHIASNQLAKIPIPSASDETQKEIEALVDRILDLRKQLPQAKTPHEKEALQRQIVGTDKQIDQLVYLLYNLTKEEVKIVEATN